MLAALDTLSGDWAVVPVLWWYEIRNVLIVNERRGRVAPSDAETLLAELALLDVEIDPIRNEAPVVALARKHRLTFYDAAYLEIAVRSGIALATLDTELVRAAAVERVDLVGRAATP